MSQQSSRKIWIIGCVTTTLILVFVGVWAIRSWQEPQIPTAPKTPAKIQTKDVASRASALPTSAPKEGEASGIEAQPFTVKEAGAIASVPQSGNLGRMTELRADLEEIKVQVAIEQEKEKLNPKKTTPAPQPQVILPEPPKPTAKPKEASPVVVSIQGVDGHASATIRSITGSLVTVRPGDKFGGGVIAAVNRTGVWVRRGNSSTTLAFE